VNKELQFYQRVVRRFLAYILCTLVSPNWLVDKALGEKCFKSQGKSIENPIVLRMVPFNGTDFDSFVEGYIAAAKADKTIGIGGMNS
jgi:hypothetical protein